MNDEEKRIHEEAFKWTVEGAYNSTCGVWELVIDPVTKQIAHFLFMT